MYMIFFFIYLKSFGIFLKLGVNEVVKKIIYSLILFKYLNFYMTIFCINVKKDVVYIVELRFLGIEI